MARSGSDVSSRASSRSRSRDGSWSRGHGRSRGGSHSHVQDASVDSVEHVVREARRAAAAPVDVSGSASAAFEQAMRDVDDATAAAIASPAAGAPADSTGAGNSFLRPSSDMSRINARLTALQKLLQEA